MHDATVLLASSMKICQLLENNHATWLTVCLCLSVVWFVTSHRKRLVIAFGIISSTAPATPTLLMLCFLHFHQAHCKASNEVETNHSTRGCQLLPSLLEMVFCSCRNYWPLLSSMVFPPGSGSSAVTSQYSAIVRQSVCSCSASWEEVHLAEVQNVWSFWLHQ